MSTTTLTVADILAVSKDVEASLTALDSISITDPIAEDAAVVIRRLWDMVSPVRVYLNPTGDGLDTGSLFIGVDWGGGKTDEPTRRELGDRERKEFVEGITAHMREGA